MRQRAAVYVFKLTTQRYTVRNSARLHATLGCEVRKIMGRRVTFDRRIGRDNKFSDLALSEPVVKLAEPLLFGPDTIER